MVTKQEILDHALVLGSRSGWEKLTLYDLASALKVPLADIYRYFPQKDDLVEAWFDRADQALLSRVPNPEAESLSTADRLEQVFLSWFGALAEYRVLTGQMLLYKLEPGHVHLQWGGLLRISRTVQWFREAAGLEASHIHRILQESLLTGLYLRTFSYWLRDDSDGQGKTRQFLRRRLRAVEWAGVWY